MILRGTRKQDRVLLANSSQRRTIGLVPKLTVAVGGWHDQQMFDVNGWVCSGYRD